ncbi:MAG TPA: thioredoxin-dependent thiol peroxidase [Spirochaetota bacterium]|nr:thioredoxin-dependent thiol peroxidase [Spirochaetota bacterium]HOM38148.1 thioredoxin-dependent thiol peroxidase [Spirochaetota bacterium]HPQ48634.1 thioredoxin-dependent thiol peroxidase [Spirochaetota bacterium]
MLNINDLAPDFSLFADNGEKVSLSDFRGKKVVLYFYPKDNTPGCTKEACSFRDVYDDIISKGAIVIGISTDSIDSHLKFKKKLNLPFYLLSDPDHKVIEMYGQWVKKSMYGKEFFGTQRSTFIIDENGKILKIFQKVKPDEHGKEILALL